MSAIEGDFIGFTFGGKHSTELGINRVSNGSRYTETLLPEFSNKTVNVPGANRVDYLGMEFTQKSFPLDIAFDSVTEEQLREMKRLFSTKNPLSLVFDESPYKTYYAKAGGNPSITHVCFDEKEENKENLEYYEENMAYEITLYPQTIWGIKKINMNIDILYFDDWIEYSFCDIMVKSKEQGQLIKTAPNGDFLRVEYEIISDKEIKFNITSGELDSLQPTVFNGIKVEIKFYKNKRIYKGEGKIDLVSFYPYAFCDPNYVANLTSENTPDNLHEWLGTSGLSETQLETNQIYNPGDFDTPFWIKIYSNTLPAGAIELGENTLIWSASGEMEDGLPEDTYIIVDGRNQLIEGYSANGVKSGRIYNKFITDGNWFNIPKDQEIDSITVLLEDWDWELNYKILYI